MSTFNLDKDISQSQTIIVDSALNFTGIVDWTRAMSLVVTREGSILIPRADGSMVRSTYLVYPRPLVVTLNRYVGLRIRNMETDDSATRSMILIRDNWTCPYGDDPHFGDTIDHVVPKSRGGKNTWGNLVASCHNHNEMKADSTPAELGWKTPVIPRVLVSKRREAIQHAVYDRLETMANVSS